LSVGFRAAQVANDPASIQQVSQTHRRT
jgi:hypothetical protein